MSDTTSNITNSLLGNLSSTPSTTQVGPQANDSQMNQFLQLLVAQLQNQDPTQPTDPTQFVAQLAQFSTVEQLVNSNSTLTNISQSVSGLDMGQYAGMINQQVDATTTSIAVPASGTPTPMTFDVTTTGLSNVNVTITDSSGNVVRTIPVSGTTGTVNFDGTDSSGQALPAGQYGVALVGTGTGDASQSAGTLSIAGTVAGVQQSSTGTWELQLQDGTVVDASSVTSVL